MKRVWNMGVHIKQKFPGLTTTEEVRDFARLDIYDYVNVVLENKELNKHLMSYIED